MRTAWVRVSTTTALPFIEHKYRNTAVISGTGIMLLQLLYRIYFHVFLARWTS